MLEVKVPLFLSELRIKNRFHRRDFRALFDGFFSSCVSTASRRAVVIVSHSGTISNMLYSHTNKQEAEVLKPRNASVIAISCSGSLGLRHEGTLPQCKNDEWHEYFTTPQFEQFASGVQFDYAPPQSCLLLLVRHGIAVNNVNKAYSDGRLTPEGEASIVKAGLRIQHLLGQAGIRCVHIFSSACVRTRHSSALLYEMLAGGGGGGLTLGLGLGIAQAHTNTVTRSPLGRSCGSHGARLAPSRSLPCLRGGCGWGGGEVGGEGEEAAWLQGAVPVGA